MSMDLADWGETPVIPDELIGEPTPEEIEALTDDTRTVADEILEEVRQCRTQQNETTADLARLREEGRENSRQYQELLTELKNLREENRNLSQELKALLTEPERSQSEENESSPSLTPTSVTTVIVPASGDIPEETSKKKRKRIVI
jgi:chromosome segregation ATPase